jgi:hypothetical protein
MTFWVLYVLFAFAVGVLARQRGRSLLNWGVISLVLTPLLAFVVLMMKEDLALADAMDTVTHDMELTHVKCVHCAEYVLPEATVCHYCQGALVPQPEFVKQRLEEKLAEQRELQAGKQANFIIGMSIVVGIAFIAWLSTFIK